MKEVKMEEYIPPTAKIPFRSNKEYHVFLSFRGKDVRNTLVDHLYVALTNAGLNVFLDSQKLKKGEIIGLSLEKAIESSAIRIPIFTRGYAGSAWCLREAATMVNTQGLIIPLFYDVDPTHVRYPRGISSPYKQAFEKHYSHCDHIQREEIEWWKYALQHICPCLQLYGHSVRYQRKEIDGWKDALKEICSRSGWSMNTTGGLEAQLIKKVVNDVKKTLESMTKDLIHKEFNPVSYVFNLPNIIGNLSQLKYLNLEGYTKSNNPLLTIGNLSQLQYLKLEERTALKKLFDNIDDLTELQYLDLEWHSEVNNPTKTTGNLRYLNLKIGSLSHLQYLNLKV